MSTKEKVFAVVAEISGRNVSEITPESALVGDLGIDSQSALHLLLVLEERLGLEIADEDAALMDTVGDILRFYGKPASDG